MYFVRKFSGQVGKSFQIKLFTYKKYAEDFNPSGLDLLSSLINITTGFPEDRFE